MLIFEKLKKKKTQYTDDNLERSMRENHRQLCVMYKP